jgi:hypothetical protein
LTNIQKTSSLLVYEISNMSLYKQTKDALIRALLGKNAVPAGLSELNRYFRIYGPINFKYEKQQDGSFVAASSDFHYGSIITSAKSLNELDSKIKDAILTSFEVPSSYAKDAAIKRVNEGAYAFA